MAVVIDPPIGAAHPFLAFGRVGRFDAGRGRAAASVVASIDGRQRSGGRQVGCIGFIDGGSAAALSAVLDRAVRWLAELGASVIHCPVNLSTWYGHRAIVDRFPEAGGRPPFLLEPRNGPALPAALEAAGFRPAILGISHDTPNDGVLDLTAPHLERAVTAGYRDRPIRTADVDGELALLHRLSSAVFADAWSYGPITVAEVEHLYQPLLPAIEPELVRVLEDPLGRAVGFVFAIPDRLGPPAGRPGSRFVVKTLAVLPDARRAFPGLGSALIARVHGIAAELGYPAGIHALMTPGAYAQRASLRWGGRPFRSYATYEALNVATTGARGRPG